ncbi:cytochrome P450 [Pholiota conissans]|uniref:Cytochrome P450 n=1 Tax=Pholiota conissans TaxID=109636 RepID=A0A9P6CUK5_9AGAR|nr:cytochrome P450 [Pholiota conissans]
MSSTVAVLAVAFLFGVWFRSSAKYPLPPGAEGYPVIGSIREIPRHFAWLTYTEWKGKYGDIFSFTVFGKTTIVLNSLKAATELLDKRSSKFSGRPRMVMADELLGWEWDLAHMPYTDRWRRHRRMFHQYFQPRNIASFYPFQKKASISLLDQLSQTPMEFIPHIRQYTGSVILRAVYGYEVKTENDFYINLVQSAILPLLPVIHTTRSFLVEFLPALKHVPVWMPGAAFKRQALADARKSQELRDIPFNAVKELLANGLGQRCFVSENLEKIKSGSVSNPEEEEEVVKNCAGIVYLAGSDTTVALITAWVSAMAQYPDIQKKAQAELENVIGKERLPEFTDMEFMPYLEAVILETQRWHTITPLALPHKVIDDDIYEGYRMPAGSTITVNTWAILHDETVYPDPFRFDPERFLRNGVINFDDQPDPTIAGAFGYGRRVCPGRYLAKNSSWMAVSSILAMYDITKAIDDKGVIIAATIRVTDGVISHPEPFKVNITPRSKESIKLLEVAKMDLSM